MSEITQYHFQFPDGSILSLPRPRLDVLADHCFPREIVGAVSLDGMDERYRVTGDTKKSSLLISQTSGSFVSSSGATMPPGWYRITLAPHSEDLHDLCLCGSFLQWLSMSSTEAISEAKTTLGPLLSMYNIAEPSDQLQYSVAVAAGRLVVAIDASPALENCLNVLPPVPIIRPRPASAFIDRADEDMDAEYDVIHAATIEGSAAWSISGQVAALAQLLPYSLLRRIASHADTRSVLFTGEGLSGSVAHACAVVCNDFLAADAFTRSFAAKSYSFAGALCGSTALAEHLRAKSWDANLVTINDSNFYLERCTFDLQCLSPLLLCSGVPGDSSSRLVSEAKAVIVDATREYLLNHVADSQLDELITAERTISLALSSSMSRDTAFTLLGLHVLQPTNERDVRAEGGIRYADSSVFVERLVSCSNIQYPDWSKFYTLKNIDVKAMRCRVTKNVDSSMLRPSISKVRVSIDGERNRLMIHIAGKNLEMVRMRGMGREVPINESNINSLPIRFKPGTYKLHPSAHLLFVRSTDLEAVVYLDGVEIMAATELRVQGDLGNSKAHFLSLSDIVKASSTVPRYSLHPTMNPEFLQAALVRVALCARQSGGVHRLASIDPTMHRLWKLLLDLEMLCECRESVFEPAMSKYLDRRHDMMWLKSTCAPRFDAICHNVTEQLQVEENMFKLGIRKTIGGIERLGGGIIGLVGAVLSIPALVLLVPAVVSASRNPERFTSGGFSSVYVGFVGILGLPGVIVSSIGAFLNAAGVYAMRDPQTFQYRQILQVLISLVDGHTADIIDEVAPMEDLFIHRFSARFPGCDLETCSVDTLKRTINTTGAIQSLGIVAALQEKLEKMPKLGMKICLVGRIRAIRRLLQNNFLIGFVGVKDSGTSTLAHNVFGESMPPSERSLGYTDPVTVELGSWMESLAQSSGHAALHSWLEKNSKDAVRLYATDFPGIESDVAREVRLASSRSALQGMDAASIFVVVLAASHHPTAADREVVDAAKEERKPILIVLNKSELIAHDLKDRGKYESLIETYARSLDVPSNIIHFMSANDAFSVDKLRGLIYGLLQNILGSESKSELLALRFLPSSIANAMDADRSVDVFEHPSGLGKAVSSLLLNLCPLSLGTVIDQYLQLQRDLAISKRASRGAVKDVRTLHSDPIDKLRRLALTLRLDEATYKIVQDIFSYRLLAVKADLDRSSAGIGIKFPSAVQALIDNTIGTVALTTLRDQLMQYTESRSVSVLNDFESLALDVILGIQMILALWTDRGFSADQVGLALRDLLESQKPFDEVAFLQSLMEIQSETTRSSVHLVAEHSSELESRGALEFNRFMLAKDHVAQMEASIRFRLFPELARDEDCRVSDDLVAVAEFQRKLGALKTRRRAIIPLTSSSELLREVVLILLTQASVDLATSDISFQIKSESAVDVSGVTRSVLSKASQELNAHPELLWMCRDEESGLIYFDPEVCSGARRGETDGTFTEFVMDALGRRHHIYRGLGRLIGLCLVKSGHGVTFPVNVPITIYRLILGYSLGTSDLAVCNPTIMHSLYSICGLDKESLTEVDLSFAVSVGPQHESFDLVPNGSSKTVSEYNRIDYAREICRYYLGCRDPASSKEGDLPPIMQFVLGVQDVCPREIFSSLRPSALQSIVEGRRDIDVAEWRRNTDVKGVSESNETVSRFWDVVASFSASDRSKLLCFATGTTSLPAGGFSELQPRFQLVVQPAESSELPTSHTCFHMLVIPRYPSTEVMKEKLLMAIRETDTAHLGMV